METIYFKSTKSLKESLKELEKKLNVKIKIIGKKVEIEGSTVDEYTASLVLNAINTGFSPKKALMLAEPDYAYREINIKEFTRRKNLEQVRARVIGREGKTKRTIEDISDSEIIVHDNTIYIIGLADSIDNAVTAIENLIRGSKQGNVYAFLERMNRERISSEELGLKKGKSEKTKEKYKL